MLQVAPEFIPAPIAEPGQTGWPMGTLSPYWTLLMLWRFAVYFSLTFIRRLRYGKGGQPFKLVGAMPARRAGFKRVLFIRHGQGAHNLSFRNFGIVDPHLTTVGEGQVAALHAEMEPLIDELELVAVSPITRALQTATGGLAGTKAKWAITPLLREWLVTPCDTGRPKAELLRVFPQLAQWEGIEDLPQVWWSRGTEYGLFGRIEQLEAWISARPEQTIAVVGHGGLFGRMLGFHLHNCGHQWVEWDAQSGAASDMRKLW